MRLQRFWVRIYAHLRAGLLGLTALCITACMSAPSDGYKTYTSFDGQALAYIDRGEGPVVLMLHGLTSNADVNYGLTGMIEAVEAEGFRVIAPDLRGHGRSTVSPDAANWPVDAMAQDQIALLDALGETPDVVVGYSMGALVALRLQALDAPAKTMLLGGMGDKTAVIGDRTRHDGIAALLARIDAGETGALEDRVRNMLEMSGSSADAVRGSLRHRMTVTRDEITTMNIPVLILNGDTDFDNGDGANLAEMFPQAEFKSVKGDHLTALRNADYIDSAVAFISRK